MVRSKLCSYKYYFPNRIKCLFRTDCIGFGGGCRRRFMLVTILKNWWLILEKVTKMIHVTNILKYHHHKVTNITVVSSRQLESFGDKGDHFVAMILIFSSAQIIMLPPHQIVTKSKLCHHYLELSPASRHNLNSQIEKIRTDWWHF